MNLFDELKRRKVVKTTLGYLAGAFVLALTVRLLVDAFAASREIFQGVVILELVALPLVIGLAWAFDITPVGVELTGSTPRTSRVAVSWRRVMLPLVATILVLLATVSFVALRKSEEILQQKAPMPAAPPATPVRQ